ncbi:T-complex protein 11-domain-containing protein [Melampsora americana]|nr:T-complex protein 11-domain-containing protein [Melampsora americana]
MDQPQHDSVESHLVSSSHNPSGPNQTNHQKNHPSNQNKVNSVKSNQIHHQLNQTPTHQPRLNQTNSTQSNPSHETIDHHSPRPIKRKLIVLEPIESNQINLINHQNNNNNNNHNNSLIGPTTLTTTTTTTTTTATTTTTHQPHHHHHHHNLIKTPISEAQAKAQQHFCHCDQSNPNSLLSINSSLPPPTNIINPTTNTPLPFLSSTLPLLHHPSPPHPQSDTLLPLSAPPSRSHFDQQSIKSASLHRHRFLSRSRLKSLNHHHHHHHPSPVCSSLPSSRTQPDQQLPNKRPCNHHPSLVINPSASRPILHLPTIIHSAPTHQMRKLTDGSRPTQLLSLAPHKTFRATSLPPSSPTKKRRKDDDVVNTRSNSKVNIRSSAHKTSRAARSRHSRQKPLSPTVDRSSFITSQKPSIDTFNPVLTPNSIAMTDKSKLHPLLLNHAPTTRPILKSSVSVQPSTHAHLPPVYRSRSAQEFSLPIQATAPVYVQLIARHALDLPRISSTSGSSKINSSYSRSSKRTSGYSIDSSSLGTAPEINLPSWIPPITRLSMAELEFVEVLKNAQLRHDIVFDDVLRFRPNLDGDRGQRKRLIADRYWIAIARELEANCRCAAFVQRFPDRHSISVSPDPRQVLGCVCSRGQFNEASSDSNLKPGIIPLDRIPSRIPPLVEELRNILLSLVVPRSQALCPNKNLDSSHTSSAHDLICSTLDPIEISYKLEKGRRIDMPALARFLGLVLKGHCAPMRDNIVDGMVSLISGEAKEFTLEPDLQNSAHDSLQKSSYAGLAGGLRMSFELLELMKLDIANHQLRTLRPVLLETALEFEIRHFRDQLIKRPSIDRTKRWYTEAVTRVQCSSGFPSLLPAEQISRAVQDGLLELVFNLPQTNLPSRWTIPLSFPFSSASTPAISALTPSPSPSFIPETFSMDTIRLQTLHSDLTDLTIAYLIIMLFKQLVGHSKLKEGDVETLKSELWVLMSEPGLKVKGKPGIGLKKIESKSWRAGFESVLLHVGSRIESLRNGERGSKGEMKTAVPGKELMKVIQNWMDQHLRLQSNLFAITIRRLRETVEFVINEEGERSERSPLSNIPTCLRTGRSLNSISTHHHDKQEEKEEVNRTKMKKGLEGGGVNIWKKSGLVELEHEIRVVGNRLKKMLKYHLRGYGGLYAHLSNLTITTTTTTTATTTTPTTTTSTVS